MSKLIVMVGLPASGKSTKANELAEQYNATVLSSDDIREELLGNVNEQSQNTKVFEVMYKRAKDLLCKDKNVIIDATNINRKRRIHLIKNELQADEYICHYIGSNIHYCLHRDNERERKVGYEVIDKMYRNMEIPLKEEGWNEVIYSYVDFESPSYMIKLANRLLQEEFESCEQFESCIEDFDNEFNKIIGLSHDSQYHSFSVSRHTYYVYKEIEKLADFPHKEDLILASIYHDLGKAHCKSFENYKGEIKRYASFIGHENVSAQLFYNYFMSFGFDIDRIIRVVKLIALHMKHYNNSAKTDKLLKQLLSEDEYLMLMMLNSADMIAK